MKILNIGSMNLDYVYQVDHITQPGETQAASHLTRFLGGKGMNQSVALALAGAEVYHGGMIGPDGQAFLEVCETYGIHSQFIRSVSQPTGHTIIQINAKGQNSILLYGGANQMLSQDYVDEVLSHFGAGDLLVLQNEGNLLPYLVEQGYQRGLTIALNPSPFHENLQEVDWHKLHILLLNEVEGGQLTGLDQPSEMLDALVGRFPEAQIVLTLGREGARYAHGSQRLTQPAFPVEAVDTTAAGDTFTGYFLAGLAQNLPLPQVLRQSAMAAALAVTRPGAVPSIPRREDVLRRLTEWEHTTL